MDGDVCEESGYGDQGRVDRPISEDSGASEKRNRVAAQRVGRPPENALRNQAMRPIQETTTEYRQVEGLS
jgi:hypothetical protein